MSCRGVVRRATEYCLLPFALLGFIAESANAGTTGKITGRVINDKKEPVLAVTCFLEGTRFGAYTNEHVHDRFSNFADAFRMFAEGYTPSRQIHASSAMPEWQRKLQAMKSGGRSRNPMAS